MVEVTFTGMVAELVCRRELGASRVNTKFTQVILALGDTHESNAEEDMNTPRKTECAATDLIPRQQKVQRVNKRTWCLYFS